MLKSEKINHNTDDRPESQAAEYLRTLGLREVMHVGAVGGR